MRSVASRSTFRIVSLIRWLRNACSDDGAAVCNARHIRTSQTEPTFRAHSRKTVARLLTLGAISADFSRSGCSGASLYDIGAAPGTIMGGAFLVASGRCPARAQGHFYICIGFLSVPLQCPRLASASVRAMRRHYVVHMTYARRNRSAVAIPVLSWTRDRSRQPGERGRIPRCNNTF